MKVVNLAYPVIKNIINNKLVIALGLFDGVHLGHQHLIKTAKTIAKQKRLPLMVLTFNRHPSEIYANNHNFQYIDSLDEKAEKMRKLGVDYFAILNFTKQFSKISGQEFVDNVLVKLEADTVVAGFDYTYGPKKIANMAYLPKLASGRFEIIKVPKQTFDGKKISSTAIRQAITKGKMEIAYILLGQHYEMSGIIGHGKRNGHKINFPTANLVWNNKKVIPKIGVYATKTEINGRWYEAMTSVGYNVTINDEHNIYIESHIFDFNENVYGQKMKIKWYKYTRSEIKFSSLTALKNKLEQDRTEIKAYFKRNIKK